MAERPARADGGPPPGQPTDWATLIPDLPSAAVELLNMYPGLQPHVVDGRVAAFYGVPMTPGATPAEAVDAFWPAHGAAFGVENLEVEFDWSAETGELGEYGQYGPLSDRPNTIFAYRQLMDGLPVQYGMARVMVKNGLSSPIDEFAYRMVYISAKLARRPIEGFPPDFISPESALYIAASMPGYESLTEWTQPELVVFAGDPVSEVMPFGSFQPARTWKMMGRTDPEARTEAYWFYVNANDGVVEYIQDAVQRFDVTGNVQGKATPGVLPDSTSNPPQPVNLRDLKVWIVVNQSVGPSAIADKEGNFTIIDSSTGPVTVATGLAYAGNSFGDPPWAYTVLDSGSPPLSVSMSVTPPGPANFVLNNSPSEVATAQVNAFLHATLTREFFAERTIWTGLNYPLKLRLLDFTCEAAFIGSELQFGKADSTCSNWAFSSMVTHEYAHFVVSQLGLSQAPGSFGEGFADAVTVLRLDDPAVGRAAFLNSDPRLPRLYDFTQLDRTYPCQTGSPACDFPTGGTEIPQYCCARILAGLWQDIREQAGLNKARQMFVTWSQITSGGYFNESAHPLTLIEILIADDDDGKFNNGTPLCSSICTAAAAHGLSCGTNPCSPAVNPPAPPGTNQILSFRLPQNWKIQNSAAIDPYGIAVGRVNADNFDDVVLTCPTSNSLVIYFGASASGSSVSFVEPPTIIALASGSKPMEVTLGDMSLTSAAPDAHKDIVVSLEGSNAVQILLNHSSGSGSFDPSDSSRSRVEIFSGANQVCKPVGLVVADFDGNGRGDIAVAGYRATNCANGPERQPAMGLLWKTATDGSYTAEVKLLPPEPEEATSERGYDLIHFFTEGTALVNQRFVMTDEILPLIYTFAYATSLQSFVPSGTLDGVQGGIPATAIAVGVVDSDTKLDLISAIQDEIRWYRQAQSDQFAIQSAAYDTDATILGLAAGRLTKSDTNPTQLDEGFDVASCRRVEYYPEFPDDPYDYRIYVTANTRITGQDLFLPRKMSVTADPNSRPFARQVVAHDINSDGLPDIVTANRGLPDVLDEWEGFSVILNRK